MAVIAMFYGVIISMYYFDNRQHSIPPWIEIHREDLMADWELASEGETIFKIDPLK